MGNELCRAEIGWLGRLLWTKSGVQVQEIRICPLPSPRALLHHIPCDWIGPYKTGAVSDAGNGRAADLSWCNGACVANPARHQEAALTTAGADAAICAGARWMEWARDRYIANGAESDVREPEPGGQRPRTARNVVRDHDARPAHPGTAGAGDPATAADSQASAIAGDLGSGRKRFDGDAACSACDCRASRRRKRRSPSGCLEQEHKFVRGKKGLSSQARS